ncbi:MAG: acyl-CoA dehydrogenase family protein, partial [Actinomycetes bacterium]
MRFALTDEQLEFRDAVRGLLEDTCPPAAVRAAWTAGREDSEGADPETPDGRVPAAWSALAEMGVLGVTVPEPLGGLGMTDEDVVPLLIECGRVGLPDPVASTAYVAAAHLAEVGGFDDVVAAIASGDASIGVGFGQGCLVANAETVDYFLLGAGFEGGG